jgi:hypothetical protein
MSNSSESVTDLTSNVQVLLLGIISLGFDPGLLVGVDGLGFDPDMTGLLVGEGMGLGVARTMTQLIDRAMLELPHSNMTCPTSTRDLNGILLMKGCSFDATVKKSLFGSKVKVCPSSTQTASIQGYVCISKDSYK